MSIGKPMACALILVGLGSTPALGQSWLDQAIQNQLRMQQWGNYQVNRMYWACVTHPGACQPDPYAAQRAMQNYANRSLEIQQHNWRTMQRNWQAIDNWNHHAIQNCVKRWYYGRAYWSCPNGTFNTLTGR